MSFMMGRLGTWLALFAGLFIGAGAVSYGFPRVELSAPSVECNIKGSINPSTGERIYYMPGQKFYSWKKIEQQLGERLFCSEDEARTAGWQKSRR